MPESGPLDWQTFWESYPVDGWPEMFDRTVTAFDEGADVVVVSGRNGVGKTLQYGMLLVRNIVPEPCYFDEATDAHPKSVEKLTEPEQLIVLDEATKPTWLHGEKFHEVLRVTHRRNPLVMIFPGATQPIRQIAVEESKEWFAEYQPDRKIVALGDVPISHINKEKALGLLSVRGVGPDVGELLDQFPALLNLRLFKSVVTELYATDRPNETEEILGSVRALIDRTSKVTAVITAPAGLRKHELFLSTSFTTEEAIQLYHAADRPLPDPSEFDIEALGFDPYKKD